VRAFFCTKLHQIRHQRCCTFLAPWRDVGIGCCGCLDAGVAHLCRNRCEVSSRRKHF